MLSSHKNKRDRQGRMYLSMLLTAWTKGGKNRAVDDQGCSRFQYAPRMVATMAKIVARAMSLSRSRKYSRMIKRHQQLK